MKQKMKEGYAIYHDLTIKASADKIFKAITQPDHLVNWWPQKCSGQPETGEIYNFHFNPDYDWYGQVLECIHNKSFHIKMTKSDSDWDPTSFGFDLEEAEGPIKVKFWHVDWPECNTHFRRSSFCWAMLLNGLKDYVEKGIIVPFENRE
jgi:uncharacterized protein YndB with AHSA1/START domain